MLQIEEITISTTYGSHIYLYICVYTHISIYYNLKKMNTIYNNYLYLEYIYVLMPEIYITWAIVFLLGYGVIYSKLQGQISQQKKIT